MRQRRSPTPSSCCITIGCRRRRASPARRDSHRRRRSRRGGAVVRHGSSRRVRQSAVAVRRRRRGHSRHWRRARRRRSACMTMIAEGVARRAPRISLTDAAAATVADVRARGAGCPASATACTRSIRGRPCCSISRARTDSPATASFMEAIDVARRCGQAAPDQHRRRARRRAARHGLRACVRQASCFIIGRVAGLTAEVAEEYAREKPMRIRIPVAYDGVAPREME